MNIARSLSIISLISLGLTGCEGSDEPEDYTTEDPCGDLVGNAAPDEVVACGFHPDKSRTKNQNMYVGLIRVSTDGVSEDPLMTSDGQRAVSHKRRDTFIGAFLTNGDAFQLALFDDPESGSSAEGTNACGEQGCRSLVRIMRANDSDGRSVVGSYENGKAEGLIELVDTQVGKAFRIKSQ